MEKKVALFFGSDVNSTTSQFRRGRIIMWHTMQNVSKCWLGGQMLLNPRAKHLCSWELCKWVVFKRAAFYYAHLMFFGEHFLRTLAELSNGVWQRRPERSFPTYTYGGFRFSRVLCSLSPFFSLYIFERWWSHCLPLGERRLVYGTEPLYVDTILVAGET